MKNCIIGLLAVGVIFLSSLVYKHHKVPIYHGINTPEGKSIADPERFLLLLFFSKQNCLDCLEIVQDLNVILPPFKVFGIVPEHELVNEEEIKQITGARFPIMSMSEYKRYIPLYIPSILGVTTKGEILFMIPGVPGKRPDILGIITSFYQKALPLILD